MRQKNSLISLILVNLYPIVGVIFFGWNLSSILFLYWFENLVLGFYNVLKMLMAQKPNVRGVQISGIGGKRNDFSKKAMVLFFVVHYGMFTFVHGIFLLAMVANNFVFQLGLLTPIILLFVSHGVSYFTNFIGKREYERVSSEDLMISPYLRIMVMHLTVIFGSWFIIRINGQMIGPLVVLTIIKTIVDLLSHAYEHNKNLPGITGKGNLTFSNKTHESIKKIFPGYEKYVADAYKKSVESGKWDEIKTELEPEVVKYIEDYYHEAK
ncbi:DUF6498-containing protein [Patescibacteria group bacterium]